MALTMAKRSRATVVLALSAAALSLAACNTFRGKVPPPPAAVAEAPPPAATAPAPPLIRPPPAPPPHVACVPRALPRAPRYPDTDAALREAGGAADRYQLMAAGRLLRIQRLNELERVVEGCRQGGQ
jgi:hypothetical protein